MRCILAKWYVHRLFIHFFRTYSLKRKRLWGTSVWCGINNWMPSIIGHQINGSAFPSLDPQYTYRAEVFKGTHSLRQAVPLTRYSNKCEVSEVTYNRSEVIYSVGASCTVTQEDLFTFTCYSHRYTQVLLTLEDLGNIISQTRSNTTYNRKCRGHQISKWIK